MIGFAVLALFLSLPLLLMGKKSKKKGYPISDHYNGKQFFNPRGESRSGRDIISWLASRKTPRWPTQVINKQFPRPEKAKKGEIKVTYINHSTFLIQIGHLSILTDPIWSKRCSPFSWLGPKRVIEPGQPLEAIPKIDLILVSHNHYDHLDKRTIQYFEQRDRPKIITSLGNKKLLHSFGCKQVTELDWWETAHFKGLPIHLVPAKHFSSRYLWDKDTTLWGGFVIQACEGSLYFAGDTGYMEGFKEIRRRFGPPLIACLPIGAYEPRWFMKPAHMNPGEAVEAHLDLQANTSIACHFGTFQLADEQFKAPGRHLQAALQRKQISRNRFLLLEPGETIVRRQT